MSIQAACHATMAAVRGVSGVRAAPNQPPDKMTIFPTAICYPGPSTFNLDNAATKRKLVTIVLELHVAYKSFGQDYEVLLPFADSVTDALLADITLGGTVQTILAGGPIEFSGLIPMNYPPNDTLGYRWQFSIKIRE